MEDIILYTLNDLPMQYNEFKIVIRTKMMPISLEDLYSLLLSKEINIFTDAAKDILSVQPNAALYVQKGKKTTSLLSKKQSQQGD